MSYVIQLLICLAFVAFQFESKAQVVNNNIKDRSELVLDGGWLHSTTSNNSVEWRCVNKALTNKCLVYHNDQWFHFTPSTSGRFFLNISSQECKKSEGIQLIIIEGNPCEINSYRILRCIPRINLEDIFLELDSLKANKQYLVNVDGFLGDFCEFDIEFSSAPKGFPQHTQLSDTVAVQTRTDENVVWLQWRVNQTEAQELKSFEVFVKRGNESRSTLKSVVPVQYNSLGRPVEEYMISDTLHQEGEYQYQVVAVSWQATRHVISKKKIKVAPQGAVFKKINAALPLSFVYPGRVEIHVFNSINGEMVNYLIHNYEKPETFAVDLGKYVQSGIREFRIAVRHNKSRVSKVFDIRVNEMDVVEVVEKLLKN